ncbi:MAG: acyl-CoA dehydrogenase [Lachnospiraceae bacterium]|nr:acyl-CoA dehydrogenase [Lachnospiraceae bacterium]
MYLTPEQSKRYQQYEEFVIENIKPHAAELDAKGMFPSDETIKKLADAGFFNILFPKEYGGQDLETLAYIMAVETTAKYCASTSILVSAQNSLVGYPFLHFGTDEQKKKYVTGLANGSLIGAFALTEYAAGSDAAKQETTAVADGDYYVLNGTKRFITNAEHADVYVVMAMTDKSQGNHGITAFIVEKGTPGFTFGKKEIKMGIRGSVTGELIFKDCRIPKENILGEVGKGFKIAMETLDCGRLGVAAQALGIAEGALEETIKYVKQREQFGKFISQFQNTQFELAEIATEIEAAKTLLYTTCKMKDEGVRYSKEAAMAKMYCSQVANDAARRCLQLFGGCGYTTEYPLERMMRDAKITEIYEGTNEIQRIVISANLGLK